MSKRNRIKNQPDRNQKKGKIEPKLSSYEPVTIEIPLIEVKDEDIETQMQETAERFPEYVNEGDRPVQESDYLVISMKTTDGEYPLENLTYDKRRISLDDEYIPAGLKEHLLEMKVEETKTISYQAPGPQIDKADDPIMVNVSSVVTLHEIQKPVVAEITDAWVSKYIPGADTVDEFRSRVKRQMEGKANAYTEDFKYSQCAAILASRLEGSIPDELFEQGMSSSKAEFEAMLKQTGMTKEQYLERQGMSEEELTFQFMAKGRQMISEGMALEAMANHLNLTIEDEDINAVFGNVTPQQAENMRKSYEQAGKGEELRRMAYCGKALEYVVAHAAISHKSSLGSQNPFENLAQN